MQVRPTQGLKESFGPVPGAVFGLVVPFAGDINIITD